MTKHNLINLGLAALAVAPAAIMAGCTPSTSSGSTPDKPAATTTNDKPGGDSGATTTTAAKRPATTGPGEKVDGDTIKLGLVASLNGDNKPWGEDSQTGANLVIDEINAAGGIKGKKVSLSVQDSNSTPEGAKSAAEKLVSEGVVAILGEVSSGNTGNIVTVCAEKGIPDIAIGATRTDLADKSNCFFRVCYTDDFQGPVMAKFAESLGLKKVALVTDQKLPYSTGLSASFAAAFKKAGGEIVDEEKYESGQSNFSGIAQQLKDKNPDGLFMSGYFTEVGPIAKAVRGAGMADVKMFGGDGWDSPTLITSGGDAIIGGYFCNHYSNFDDRPEVKDFLTKWKAKTGALPGTTMGALGYDAAKLACDALTRATDLSSASMIKALDDTENFKGVSGTITLKGQNGNPKKDALVVVVKKDGFYKAQSFKPEEIQP